MIFQQFYLLFSGNKKTTLLVAISIVCIFTLSVLSWSYYKEQKARHLSAVSLDLWLGANLSALQSVSSGNKERITEDVIEGDSRSLVSMISETAKANNITLSRLEPKDEKDEKVTAVIDEAPFSVVAKWLWRLSSNQNVIAYEAAFTYLGDDKASVRVVLVRKN